VYLPHLDYCLQKFGPDAPEILPELRQIDEVAGELIDHVQRDGTRVIVLSEYGVTRVSGPIHINRALREAGLIAVREELGRELIDPGACEAFAVADHQIAHVYVRDPLRVSEVSELLGSLDGIEEILGDAGKAARGLDHPRSGELIAIAKADRWFTYYYWLDDDRAPDFARCVDIHRKPGYDPAELFVDPALRFPKLGIGWRLLKKRLGFRALMDVIPLDASMVRGSHGRVTDDPDAGPLIMTSEGALLPETPVAATDVKQLILDHVFGRP
jgi:predicted AlkP superfamily pyrophosphatase or phosphodiesterase